MIDIKYRIKRLLHRENMTVKDLSTLMNTSQQNMNAKLQRNNLKIHDIEKIAKVLGYKVILIFKKEG